MDPMSGTFFVDCGAAWLTRLMNGTVPVTTYFLGWGEGGTAVASKGSFQVCSETQARNSAPSSISAFNQVQWMAVMTATGVRSINNAALLNTNSGHAIIHGDFSTIALATNDRIEFTVTLTST
jgi:hypothetical protein